MAEACAVVHDKPELLIIDGYTDLADNASGLGRKLYNETGVPVIGIAKTPYAGTPCFPVTRGSSSAPLYVTTAGVSLAPVQYAEFVSQMHGPFRISTLLKLADFLSQAA
jgi:deoxyribonuclease V